MRRPLIAAALALALAGCSDGEVNPIVVAAVGEILPGERARRAEGAAGGRPSRARR